jgi:ribonucleoside-diphosphate reductase alpha chain
MPSQTASTILLLKDDGKHVSSLTNQSLSSSLEVSSSATSATPATSATSIKKKDTRHHNHPEHKKHIYTFGGEGDGGGEEEEDVDTTRMYVINRRNKKKKLRLDRITDRITPLCKGLNKELVVPEDLTMAVAIKLQKGIRTSQIDELVAELAMTWATKHPDYNILAGRLIVSNLHRDTCAKFSTTMQMCANNVTKEGKPAPLVKPDLLDFVMRHKQELDTSIDYNLDYNIDAFAIRTLEKSYLHRLSNNQIAERPQHMWMRVACFIYRRDKTPERAIRFYRMMATKCCTMATPVLMNSGRSEGGSASCFLLTMKDDSIHGIYDTLKDTALISQKNGGIGISLHNIRAAGSYIKGSGGVSNGIMPMLSVFAKTASYVDQGGGKRKGGIATYLEPWHADFMEWLDQRRPSGDEERRFRHMNHGIWCPDLFMKRVLENGLWSFFSPDTAPGLAHVWGKNFEDLYEKYEKEGRARRTIAARELWDKIIHVQCETGQPYMCFKDACNAKNNQQNLGTLLGSNLCTEIMEYTSPTESAVCTLASIGLPAMVKKKMKNVMKSETSVGGSGDGDEMQFDFELLQQVTRELVVALNNVIDQNFYPTPEAKHSTDMHRPIGIGIQGLANTFAMLKYSFGDQDSRDLNRKIAETIYYAAMDESCNLAIQDGKPYASFPGSPLSRGVFQFDMWTNGNSLLSGRYDWEALRKRVMKHGVKNSLLIAPMPTATTSQILGNNESFEPFTSNMYQRRTLAGEFVCLNNHLVKELQEIKLWNTKMKNSILAYNGSIQAIESIPQKIRERYRTVWEIDPSVIVDMAADRGAFICQSQSLNLYLADPTPEDVSSYHFYAWQRGLKTGMYYLRSTAASDPQRVTLDPQFEKQLLEKNKNIKGSNNQNTHVSYFTLKRDDIKTDKFADVRIAIGTDKTRANPISASPESNSMSSSSLSIMKEETEGTSANRSKSVSHPSDGADSGVDSNSSSASGGGASISLVCSKSSSSSSAKHKFSQYRNEESECTSCSG